VEEEGEKEAVVMVEIEEENKDEKNVEEVEVVVVMVEEGTIQVESNILSLGRRWWLELRRSIRGKSW
jgi:hypothetical protein